MSALGHFNRTIFSSWEFLDINFKMFVRFMVNLAMELTEPEFMHLWCELGNRLFGMAEQCYYAWFREAVEQDIIREVKHPDTGDTWVELVQNELPF